MSFISRTPVRLYGDNWSAIYIVPNPIFNERTKRNKVDCHLAQKRYNASIIEPKHVSSTN